MQFLRPFLVFCLCLWTSAAAFSAANAAANSADVCDQAAARAAKNSVVPLEILMAISRVETGRSDQGVVKPWQWAVNQQGEGHWFDDANQAIDFGKTLLENDQENFDVGCFQINLHWHGKNFKSLESAFDPDTNADYAVKFLTKLLKSEGSWSNAVAAYHSRSPEEGQAYLVKVDAALTDLRAGDGGPPPAEDQTFASAEPPPPRENNFPLLQAGTPGVGGSLVPITDGGIPLFATLP